MLQRETKYERYAMLGVYVVTLPRLRQRRLRVSLSQRELAKASGVAASTIARIESGAQAHPSTVRRLASALGCAPSGLRAPD